MKNLQSLGLEVLTAEEMQSIRGGYNLLWNNGDDAAKEPNPGDLNQNPPPVAP